MRLGEARTPDGTRLYAIGDVHGCDALLADAHRKIAADLATRRCTDHRIVHVGDYLDRGPHSAAVIERLAGIADPRVVCLCGNHDAMLLDFLANPAGAGPRWLMNGAGATLESYGVDAAATMQALAEDLAAALPDRHLKFLKDLRYSVQFGDFFFCHAGIRPGVPLAEQTEEDLIWIREEFLRDSRDHGVVVVHGHTPAPAPEVRSNRINIDTGAVFGGPLTVLALEGPEHRFL